MLFRSAAKVLDDKLAEALGLPKAEEKKDKTASSLVPRVEENYGSFVVTVDLGEIGAVTEVDPSAETAASATAGGAQ